MNQRRQNRQLFKAIEQENLTLMSLALSRGANPESLS